MALEHEIAAAVIEVAGLARRVDHRVAHHHWSRNQTRDHTAIGGIRRLHQLVEDVVEVGRHADGFDDNHDRIAVAVGSRFNLADGRGRPVSVIVVRVRRDLRRVEIVGDAQQLVEPVVGVPQVDRLRGIGRVRAGLGQAVAVGVIGVRQRRR